jgi:hypothetical protein
MGGKNNYLFYFTHPSTRFLFTYNKNVGVSDVVFAFFKTLGFRFTMEAFQQGFRFPVLKLHSYIHKVPLHLQQERLRLSCCLALSRL